MAVEKPLDFYFWPVPNGWKVAIMLEECGLQYKTCPVDIFNGAQFEPSYLALNPNNKVPTIVDPCGPDGKPYTVFESGAILLYLAEKASRFASGDSGAARHTVTQWLMFQMAGVGPMFGQWGYFNKYARGSADDLRHGKERYRNETHRLYRVMEKRLSEAKFFAGEEYSIADMAIFPWIQPGMHDIDLDQYPHVKVWYELIKARPAVKRAYELLADKCKLGDRSDATHTNMFGSRQLEVGKSSESEPATKRANLGKLQLWYTPIANHVHAVEAVLAHCQLAQDVELIATSPFKVEDGRPGFATLGSVNPLLTVPALKTPDGRALYGGPVIYEYLDSIRKSGASLFDGGVDVRRALWLADGLFDSFVKLIIEAWEKQPRAEYATRTWRKLEGCLDALNDDAQRWQEMRAPLDIGQLRAACTLNFISNRQPSDATRLAGKSEDFDWRQGRSALAKWYEEAWKLDCFTARIVDIQSQL